MSRTSLVFVALAALAAAVVPAGAAAHGVEAEVDQREGAVAVRARYHGGRPLADARFEVQSPRGGDAPFAEGRTDRHGWLAFTPDVPGKWTVRIADATGHGKTVEVDVASVAPPAAATPAPAAASAAPTRPDAPPAPAPAPPAGREGDAAVGTLRALAGAAAIAAVFVALFAVQRVRRGKGG